jgi:anti-sigma B factor antagonist
MTNNLPSLLVALADHVAIVKINGRANFTTSVPFKRLVTELRQRGFESFVLDLSECVTMDSTFLGVLAGTALKLSEHRSPRQNVGQKGELPSNAHLRLLNPNERVSDLIDNLGISDLFRTVRCETQTRAAQYQSAPDDVHPTQEELSRTCLEAHRLLMDLNPRNIPKFKEVAQFLAEDLKKLTAQAKDAPANQHQPVEACMSDRKA